MMTSLKWTTPWRDDYVEILMLTHQAAISLCQKLAKFENSECNSARTVIRHSARSILFDGCHVLLMLCFGDSKLGISDTDRVIMAHFVRFLLDADDEDDEFGHPQNVYCSKCLLEVGQLLLRVTSLMLEEWGVVPQSAVVH
jgi:hypothetical protein